MMSIPTKYRDALNEIVDDSEPERAEIRRRLRRPMSKSLSPHSSEEDLRLTLQRQSPMYDTDIIEITDSDSEAGIETPREPRETPPNYHPGPIPNAISSSSRIVIDSPSHVKATNLKRFAFVAPPNRNNSIARKSSTMSTLPSDKSPEEGVSVRPLKLSPFDLAKLDLNKLSRCVSCELNWTARKTAIQKKKHIASCAKKRSLNEETIWILVQDEISRGNAQAKPDQRQTPQGAISKTNTLLEDVIVEAAPKKKSRNNQTATLLTTVSSTRDDILLKAKAILSTPSSLTIHEDTLVPLPRFASEGMPLSTQPFAPSGLARMQGSTGQTLFANAVQSSQNPGLPGLHSFGDNFQPISTRPSELSRELLSEHVGDSKAPPAGSDSEDWSSSSVASLKKVKKKRALQLSSALSCSSDADVAVVTKGEKRVSPTKARERKSKRTSKFGADWENHMKQHIMRDADLHHRILRYEPVHFSVFMEMATLYAPASNRLKLHLRDFLDRQAIHFYEGQTWRR